MRSLFLALLLANLVFFVLQFDLVRGSLETAAPEHRPLQLNAERLRIVRDTSLRTGAPVQPAVAPTP